jgi:hypothetical protein
MGLFLKQDEQRTQIQSKIAADLQERLKVESVEVDGKKSQPAILDDQQQTGSFVWLWILLGIVALVGAIIVLK